MMVFFFRALCGSCAAGWRRCGRAIRPWSAEAPPGGNPPLGGQHGPVFGHGPSLDRQGRSTGGFRHRPLCQVRPRQKRRAGRVPPGTAATAAHRGFRRPQAGRECGWFKQARPGKFQGTVAVPSPDGGHSAPAGNSRPRHRGRRPPRLAPPIPRPDSTAGGRVRGRHGLSGGKTPPPPGRGRKNAADGNSPGFEAQTVRPTGGLRVRGAGGTGVSATAPVIARPTGRGCVESASP